MQKSKGNSWKNARARAHTERRWTKTYTRRANKQQLCMLFITVLKVLIKTNHHKNGEDVNGKSETDSNGREQEIGRKRKSSDSSSINRRKKWNEMKCSSNKYYVMCDEWMHAVKNDAKGKLQIYDSRNSFLLWMCRAHQQWQPAKAIESERALATRTK